MCNYHFYFNSTDIVGINYGLCKPLVFDNYLQYFITVKLFDGIEIVVVWT